MNVDLNFQIVIKMQNALISMVVLTVHVTLASLVMENLATALVYNDFVINFMKFRLLAI